MGKSRNRTSNAGKLKTLQRQGQIIGDRHLEREVRGNQQLAELQSYKTQKYDLDWFKPIGRQQEIVDAVDQYDWVCVEAPSGVGKTSCIIWKALNLLQQGRYKKIVFVRGVMEVGDDLIGYLKGTQEDKLSAHFEATRELFLDFMGKGKLECEERNGNISFKIPNFMLGATIQPDTIYILNECQTFSPSTLKLLMERVSDGCKLLMDCDRQQEYAVKKRKDGVTDFLDRVTEVDENKLRYSIEPLFKYVKLDSSCNQRGLISKRVTELYEI